MINPEALKSVDRDIRRQNAAITKDDYHGYDIEHNTHISIGRVVPGNPFADQFLTSYAIGAAVRIKTFSRHALYIDINYPFFQPKYKSSNVDQTLFLVYLTDRIRLRDRMFYHMGAGINFANSSVTDPEEAQSQNGTYLGFFLGMDLEVYRSTGWIAVPAVRLYTYKSDYGWHEFATAGVNFCFKLF